LAARLTEADVAVDDLDADVGRLLAAGLVVERSVPAAERALVEDDAVEEMLLDVGLISVFDTTVRVASAAPLVEELRDGLRNLAPPTPAAGLAPAVDAADASTHDLEVHLCSGTWTVRWDGEARYHGTSTDTALYDALINLNHHGSRRATELGWTVLHGGAVSIRGQAVAMVGHSGAGKSTLTTALTLRGHAYVADEVVAVRDDFTVAPFHRPIGLRRGGADQIDADVPDGPYEHIMPYHVPGALGGGERLGLVVILRRCDEPTDARLEDLGEAAALFALANQTLGATEFERDVFWRLDRLVRSIRVAELHYSAVADAIDVLERFAAEASR
jgi:hypothetical protein